MTIIPVILWTITIAPLLRRCLLNGRGSQVLKPKS